MRIRHSLDKVQETLFRQRTLRQLFHEVVLHVLFPHGRVHLNEHAHKRMRIGRSRSDVSSETETAERDGLPSTLVCYAREVHAYGSVVRSLYQLLRQIQCPREYTVQQAALPHELMMEIMAGVRCSCKLTTHQISLGLAHMRVRRIGCSLCRGCWST